MDKSGAKKEPEPNINNFGSVTLEKRSFHEFRSNFFSSRVISECNGLPNEVKKAGYSKKTLKAYTGITVWVPGFRGRSRPEPG